MPVQASNQQAESGVCHTTHLGPPSPPLFRKASALPGTVDSDSAASCRLRLKMQEYACWMVGSSGAWRARLTWKANRQCNYQQWMAWHKFEGSSLHNAPGPSLPASAGHGPGRAHSPGHDQKSPPHTHTNKKRTRTVTPGISSTRRRQGGSAWERSAEIAWRACFAVRAPAASAVAKKM